MTSAMCFLHIFIPSKNSRSHRKHFVWFSLEASWVSLTGVATTASRQTSYYSWCETPKQTFLHSAVPPDMLWEKGSLVNTLGNARHYISSWRFTMNIGN